VTSLVVEKGKLTTFLSGFGPEVNDLRLTASTFQLEGKVALPSHIISRVVSATIHNAGEIIVSDVKKVLKFLQSLGAAANNIQLDQPTNRPLRVSCGKTSITLPSTEYVRSSVAMGAASKILEDLQGSCTWKTNVMSLSGRLQTKDIDSIKSMNKVVGKKDSSYFVGINPSTQEFTVRVGDKGEAQMFVSAELDNCNGADKEMVFGPWFADLMSIIPSGIVEVLTLDEAPLVINHVDKEFTMVVVDKVVN